MTDETQRAILANLQRFLATVRATQEASAAPCAVCAAPIPATYRYCDVCGAQVRPEEVRHADV